MGRPVQAAVVLILGVLAPAFQARCQDSNKVWTDHNEVWIETTEGPRQLTHDGVPKRCADLSPSGKRVIYLAEDRSSDVEQRDWVKEAIVEIDVNGLVLRHITPEGYVHGFSYLQWIDDQRVGVEGSCNVQGCAYWVLNSDSGATLKEFLPGYQFVWSHDRSCLAWRVFGHRPDDGEQDGVMLNATWTYPPKDEARQRVRMKAGRRIIHSDDFGPFKWSPGDKWLGFADTIFPEEHTYIVLVSPTGVILRKTMPAEIYGMTLRLNWIDDTHFHLLAGERTFTFVVDDMQLREVAAPETR